MKSGKAEVKRMGLSAKPPLTLFKETFCICLASSFLPRFLGPTVILPGCAQVSFSLSVPHMAEETTLPWAQEFGPWLSDDQWTSWNTGKEAYHTQTWWVNCPCKPIRHRLCWLLHCLAFPVRLQPHAMANWMFGFPKWLFLGSWGTQAQFRVTGNWN